MPKTVPPPPRKPAPNPAPRGPSLPPPRRGGNVALRDNQARRKEQPRDLSTNSATVFDLAAVEPVEAARRCQKAIAAMNSGFHEERHRHIAEAYAIACGLENNVQAWRNFIDDEFWQHRKRPPKMDDQREPLLHVMVFVFKAVDRIRYQRISKYAAALKQVPGDTMFPRKT